MSRASGSKALIGSVARVDEPSPSRLLLSDKIYRLRLWEDRITADFCVLVMGSTMLRHQIEEVISGAEGLANNIAQSDIRELLIPLPPLPEQRAIVTHIEKEIAKLDALRTATERTIGLLKERRAALIAAVVTGRIAIHGNTADNLPGGRHEN